MSSPQPGRGGLRPLLTPSEKRCTRIIGPPSLPIAALSFFLGMAALVHRSRRRRQPSLETLLRRQGARAEAHERSDGVTAREPAMNRGRPRMLFLFCFELPHGSMPCSTVGYSEPPESRPIPKSRPLSPDDATLIRNERAKPTAM